MNRLFACWILAGLIVAGISLLFDLGYAVTFILGVFAGALASYVAERLGWLR